MRALRNIRILSRPVSGRLFLSVFLVLSFFLFSDSADAQTEGNSSSFGVFVELDLIPLLGPAVGIDLGPVSTASGNAPPDYTDSDSVISATVSSGLLGNILNTDVLSTNASSDIGNDTTSADATVDDLEVSIVGALPLLTIDADTVVSNAEVNGDCTTPALTATGTTTIEGAGVGGTLGIGLDIDVSPAPNTELINLLGIRVILNEQILTGNGTDSRGITVNAIHIDLTDTVLSLLGVLSGDIIIAQSQAQVECNEVLASSDLSIVKTDSEDPATVGDAFTYTLTVANGGPDDATNVMVTDILPSSFTVGTITPSQGTCNPLVGSTLTCNLGTIANGGNATVTIEVTPTQAGNISNTAVVSGDQSDPDPTDNSSTQSTTVVGAGEPSANLSVVKSGSPDPVIVNQELTYTVTVTNLGPDIATNTVVTDTLPNDATFGSATSDQGTCGQALGVVTCNLGDVAAGASVNITIIITPTATGSAVNNVTVDSDVDDPDTNNNSDTEVTDVDPVPLSADISVTKTGSPNPVIVNQQLTYTVTVSNAGPDTAVDVVLTDTLPPASVYVSAVPNQGTCSQAVGVVTCNLGNIPDGDNAQVTIIIIPTVVGIAANSVVVSSDTPDPDPDDNSDEENTDVDPAPPGPSPSGPAPSPTGSPGPGGPIVSSIPTLSGWAMMILPALLVLVSAYVLRKQARRQGSRV